MFWLTSSAGLKGKRRLYQRIKSSCTPLLRLFPAFMAALKFTKKDNPFWLIIDDTGSIGYNVSRSLADIISPLVGTTSQHVLNSKQLVEDMGEVTINDDECLISHDVVSLFTNTPIERILDIIRMEVRTSS